MPPPYDPDAEDRLETIRHQEEMQRERMQEEEVEAEMAGLSVRANRSLVARIFIFIAVVFAGGLFVHLYLHPVAEILSGVADSLRSAIPPR